MLENTINDKLLNFRKNLSKCVNVNTKIYTNKELILSYTPIKKQIGFITYGKAFVIKTDIDGNTTIMRELKENDIFSNLFYKYSEDEIYIVSNNYTEVVFVDYYSTLKNCQKNCPYHTNLVIQLFELLIEDNRQLTEKIELLSKRSVREKITFFLKKRMNKENIFKVTTSYKAIAEYIAVDRSNFMRELNKMEKEGLLKKEGRLIYIYM